MAKVRIHVNLTKWIDCKAIGETAEAFEARMNYFIEGANKEIKLSEEELKHTEDIRRHEWLKGNIAYYERKINGYNREINKARKEAH